MAEELIVINEFGEIKQLIQLNPNWRDDFNEYEAGYDSAPNKAEYNQQMMKKIRERNPL